MKRRIPDPYTEPSFICIHGAFSFTVLVKGTAGLDCTIIQEYGNQMSVGNPATFTADLADKPASVNGRLITGGKTNTFSSAVNYCLRLTPKEGTGDEYHNHDGDDDSHGDCCNHLCPKCQVEYCCHCAGHSCGTGGSGTGEETGGTNAPPGSAQTDDTFSRGTVTATFTVDGKDTDIARIAVTLGQHSQASLTEIVKSGKDDMTRLAAIDRLHDHAVLAEIAKSGKGLQVREAAARKLNADEYKVLLDEIAQNVNEDCSTRVKLLEKLNPGVEYDIRIGSLDED